MDSHDAGAMSELLAPSVVVQQPDGTSCAQLTGESQALTGYQAIFSLTKGRFELVGLRHPAVRLAGATAGVTLAYRYGHGRTAPIFFELRHAGSAWTILKVLARCGAPLGRPAPAPGPGAAPTKTAPRITAHPVAGCTVDLSPTQQHTITVFPSQPGIPTRTVHTHATSLTRAQLLALCAAEKPRKTSGSG
jgi:hypothetical protein